MDPLGRTWNIWEQRERSRSEARTRANESVHACLPAAAALLKAAGCTEAWIGSFACGHPYPDSDVDILVRGLTPANRADLWWNLSRLFDREVDLGEIERVDSQRPALALKDGIRFLP